VTALANGIETLRRVVSETASGDHAQLDDAIDLAVFQDPEVVSRPGADAIDHVSVTPAEPTTVEDLEGILGPARRLPRNPSGGSRTVIFGETVPDEGESGATVLAEVDEEGRVSRLIVRADTF
jgi:hypothetical protein